MSDLSSINTDQLLKLLGEVLEEMEKRGLDKPFESITHGPWEIKVRKPK